MKARYRWLHFLRVWADVMTKNESLLNKASTENALKSLRAARCVQLSKKAPYYQKFRRKHLLKFYCDRSTMWSQTKEDFLFVAVLVRIYFISGNMLTLLWNNKSEGVFMWKEECVKFGNLVISLRSAPYLCGLTSSTNGLRPWVGPG